MAQVTGGSTYDHAWRADREMILTLLRSAADAYSAQRLKGISSTFVLGVILRPLVFHVVQIRPIATWIEPSLTTTAILSCRHQPIMASIPQTVESLERVFSTAAAQWEISGYPEDPRPETVLNQLIEILFNARYIKHPPNEERLR